MARRYDSGTTTFSPEGRLYQVEYAIGAINNAAASVGVLCPEGVVIASEKKVASKLLAPPRASEKMLPIADHCLAAVAGLTADANILIAAARLQAQRHAFTYGSPIPIESLVTQLADQKHSYTQYGGLRPFGCAFLFAGWDAARGFQLYQSDPSGNYSGWKATAIGNNSAAAIAALKSEYPSGDKDKKEKEEAAAGAGAGAGAAAAAAEAVPAVDAPFGLAEAQRLAVRVLCKALDTAHPSSERVEVALLTHETIIAALAGGAAAAGAGAAAAAGAAATPVPAAALASSATGAIAPGGAARIYAGRGKLVQAFMTPAQVDALIAEAVPPVPEAEAPGGVKASI